MRVILVTVLAGFGFAAWAGPDMTAGKPRSDGAALPPGTVPMGQGAGVDMRVQNDVHVTPLSLAVFEWGIPFSRGWNVYGVRLNLCVPEWHAGHNDLYGIDAGLCGEVNGDAAGISCNVFDNVCRDFGGIQVGGLYNRIKGDAPFAIQATLVHNHANAMNGLQAGLWNLAGRFRGIQIGVVNHAESGAGLQIGLWNQCGTQGSPILGAIF